MIRAFHVCREVLGPIYRYGGPREEITSNPSAEESVKLAKEAGKASHKVEKAGTKSHRCGSCPLKELKYISIKQTPLAEKELT